MEDTENVLMELSNLEKSPQVDSIPACLDEYLTSVANTGKALFAWNKVKPLFKRKLELIIQEFSETCPTENLTRQPNVDLFNFEQMKERIFEQLESYTGVPFTIQRLCELMVQPKKHYKRIDKYMRGLEKVMLVVSTVDPIPGTSDEARLERTASTASTDPGLESPSKRIRLASASEDEAGPCDSADSEASEAGPSSHQNGLQEAIEAGLDVSEMGEDMEIDTECTSSQARLSVTETDSSSSDEHINTGVESSADPAPGPAPHLDTDTPMDTEERLTASDPGTVESSSSGGIEAGASMEERSEAQDSDGVSTSDQDQTSSSASGEARAMEDSGAASSSGDQASLGSRSQETETNSEAEPAAAEMDNPHDQREETGSEVEAGSSQEREAGDQQGEVASPSVQSSEEASNTDSHAPSASTPDSGAADSSDQAHVPGPGDLGLVTVSGEVSASEVRGEVRSSDEVTEAGAEAVGEAVESEVSPDQSDTPAQ